MSNLDARLQTVSDSLDDEQAAEFTRDLFSIVDRSPTQKEFEEETLKLVEKWEYILNVDFRIGATLPAILNGHEAKNTIIARVEDISSRLTPNQFEEMNRQLEGLILHAHPDDLAERAFAFLDAWDRVYSREESPHGGARDIRKNNRLVIQKVYNRRDELQGVLIDVGSKTYFVWDENVEGRKAISGLVPDMEDLKKTRNFKYEVLYTSEVKEVKESKGRKLRIRKEEKVE